MDEVLFSGSVGGAIECELQGESMLEGGVVSHSLGVGTQVITKGSLVVPRCRTDLRKRKVMGSASMRTERKKEAGRGRDIGTVLVASCSKRPMRVRATERLGTAASISIIGLAFNPGTAVLSVSGSLLGRTIPASRADMG